MALLSLLLMCAIVVFVLVRLALVLEARRRYKFEAARRGCSPAPVLPNKDIIGFTRLLDMLKATREDRGPQHFVETMDAVGENVHTLQVQVLGSEMLATRDPENVKAIFVTHASSFEIGAYRAGSFKPLLGLGIFTLRGEAWRHSRALLRPQFSREQLSDMELEKRHVDNLSAVLRAGADGWTKAVDLQPLFFNMTLELMTEFLYGQSPSQMNKKVNAPDTREFGYHFDAGKFWLNTRLSLGKWHWLVHPRQFTVHCEKVHQYVDYFVKAKLTSGAKETSKEGKFVLLDELAKHTKNALQLRSETLNVLSAGRDTTASLLSWTFYFLSRSPTVFEELRSAVLADIGSTVLDIDFAKLKKCHALQNCINEVLRLTAIVPIMERVSLEETVLPTGGGPTGLKPILIPKGQRILISTYALQHRADIWGDAPGEFRPERWNGRRVGMEFVPFGGGPRKCVGQQFALSEASYTVVRFLQRFDKLENMENPAGQPIRFQHALSIRSGTGAQVKLHEARAV